MKYIINYLTPIIREEEIEARSEFSAIEEFRKDNKHCAILDVKYVYTGDEEPKEWYCQWWNGSSWQSKIVIAHDCEEIMCNIRKEIPGSVYDFDCCLNTPESIDGFMRSKID